MDYGQVFYVDMANGIGAYISLLVSGCTYHCPGRFNKETWDFNFGEPFTRRVEDNIIECLQSSHVDGLSLLGGEPMGTQNQHTFLPFSERVKQEMSYATIWIYSGYAFEELLDSENLHCCTETAERILRLSDIPVGGELILMGKDVNLRFRGSRDQRILGLKKSLRVHAPVRSHYGQPRKRLY